MAEAPPTRASLMIRLRDSQDQQAWAQFVEIYAPSVYGYLRKRGLQDANAADLTQECLHRVTEHVHSLEINREHGTFRGWFFTIVRNGLRKYYAGADLGQRGTGAFQVGRSKRETGWCVGSGLMHSFIAGESGGEKSSRPP